MRGTFVVIGLTLGLASSTAAARKPDQGQLESFHCLVATEAQGVVMRSEVWARGDRARSHLIQIGDQRLEPGVTTLQVGSASYTFEDGGSFGRLEELAGFARFSLIEQIRRVQKKGRKTGTVEIEGRSYDKYQYDPSAAESIEAWLDPSTSAPFAWTSTLRTRDGESQVRMVYGRSTMEVNVEVPDELLALPEGVVFER